MSMSGCSQVFVAVITLLLSSACNPPTPTQPSGIAAQYLGGGVFSWAPCFAPDGSSIVFVSLRHEPSELYSVKTDGSGIERLTEASGWKNYPTFAPDGKNILFLSDSTDPRGELSSVAFPKGVPTPFAPGITGPSVPTFNSQRTLAAFSGEENGKKGVFVSALDGSDLVSMDHEQGEDLNPVFAVDDDTLVFTRRQWDSTQQPPLFSELCIADAKKGTVRSIARLQGVTYFPFGVKGGRIFYLRHGESNASELWSINVDGTREQRVCSPGHTVSQPALTSDGQTIAFICDVDTPFEYEVCTIDAMGTKPVKQLTSLHGYVSGLRISPDNLQILFVWDRKECPGRGKGELKLVPLSGGDVRSVCKNY